MNNDIIGLTDVHWCFATHLSQKAIMEV